MEHPVLKSKNRLLTYIAIWLAVTLFQYFFASPERSITIFLTLIIQNVTLALLLLVSWYGLRYISLETQKPYQVIFNHLVYLLVIVFIWLGLANLIDRVFLKEENEVYLAIMYPIRIFIGLFSYLLYVTFIYLEAYHQSYLEKIKIERQLNDSLKEAELNLLKSQMNPHFIYNSLNSISSLTLLNPEKAHEMVLQLSDFLRYTVGATSDQLVTLQKELEMCRSYLEIEKIRFGQKVNFSFQVDKKSLPCQIPAMILQTLFENAIKYGVYNSLGGEQITFQSKMENNWLQISIHNTFDPSSPPQNGTQTGLKNVRNRLDLVYDHAASIETLVHENIFTVTLNIPQTHEN